MKELVVNQTFWGHIRVSGPDRARFLQGLCTANIESLAAGGWLRAAVLNPKGRVLSVIEVIHEGESLLVHCEPDLADRTMGLLRKYAVIDEVEFERVEQDVHREWLDPTSVWSAPPILTPAPRPTASAEDVEVRRIEAGFPRYGVDVSEDYFPFESKLRDYIDYQKGCYLGQEPVARAHNRGHANRTLMGLRVEGEGTLASGSRVSHPERPDAGIVTSVALSPTFGSIALAYLHRAVWTPGTRVQVADRNAVVSDLPFS